MPEKKTCYINFYAGIDQRSVAALMRAVQNRLQEGVTRFVILISSPGGQVAAGLSAYNFLKGIPAKIVTHNYGSVDSVAIVVYCAGTRRKSVPNARFFLHGVGFNVPQGTRFETKQLEEKMKGLRIDIENLARVIAETCSKDTQEVEKDMLEVRELNPTQAQSYGLVHKIDPQLYPKGADVILIAPK